MQRPDDNTIAAALMDMIDDYDLRSASVTYGRERDAWRKITVREAGIMDETVGSYQRGMVVVTEDGGL